MAFVLIGTLKPVNGFMVFRKCPKGLFLFKDNYTQIIYILRQNFDAKSDFYTQSSFQIQIQTLYSDFRF